MKHSIEYHTYLASAQWQRYRQRVLKHYGFKCAKCKKSGVILQIHHKHYLRLGHERLDDCQPLCMACHVQADKTRKMAPRWGRRRIHVRKQN